MRSAAADGAAGSVVGGIAVISASALVGALFNTSPPAPAKVFTHIFDSFTRLISGPYPGSSDAAIANPEQDRVRVTVFGSLAGRRRRRGSGHQHANLLRSAATVSRCRSCSPAK